MDDDGMRDVLTRMLSGEELTPAGEVVARKLSERLGFVKEANGDMMIAWYPPVDIAAALAVEDGEAPEDLHLTIVFIPADAQADPAVVQAVTLLCAQWEEKMVGTISGTGRFVLDGDMDAFFATVDVPGLERLRTRLIEKLEYAGVWVSQKHGFTPHITLKYMPRTEPLPGRLWYPVPIEICSLTVQERQGLRHTYGLWDWEENADASEPDVAMAAPRPDDPASAARYDIAVKAGMGACEKCGTVMLEKDGDLICIKCTKGKDTKKSADAVDLPALTYVALPHPDAVLKNEEGKEWQYTLGPLYAPGVVDAHDEYADDEDLHAAVLRYSLQNDRRLKLQHDTSREVGTWVELVRWPYDHTVTLERPGEEPRAVDLPAGTIYLGVLWDDDAWAAVKDGSLGGLSLGGRAVRVEDGKQNDKGSDTASKSSHDVAVNHRSEDQEAILDVVKWQASERDEDRHLLRSVLSVLAKSVERDQPPTQVHVVQPSVNVSPKSPDVHVTSPAVNVETPTINVEAPVVEVTNEWRPTKNVVTKRDENGYVIETQTTHLDD